MRGVSGSEADAPRDRPEAEEAEGGDRRVDAAIAGGGNLDDAPVKGAVVGGHAESVAVADEAGLGDAPVGGGGAVKAQADPSSEPAAAQASMEDGAGLILGSSQDGILGGVGRELAVTPHDRFGLGFPGDEFAARGWNDPRVPRGVAGRHRGEQQLWKQHELTGMSLAEGLRQVLELHDARTGTSMS